MEINFLIHQSILRIFYFYFQEKITCMSWSPRNLDSIFTASEKGTVVVWKLKSNTVRSFRIEKEFIYCIKASPHSPSHLAIG